ncbi:RCC1 domain-containing protein [Silvanigrella aquatica]|uniref:Uncharacterized protein n=1 Tax=Silvanigrella aquatica TaxID=1915309 RepID=A0A1L4D2I7_9BACT|nr:hypothetical protein [Silvanigrella aquatica]APJ04402.1 hypothetical protein AXG55_10985 [Silvanigrella aquatica]
MENKIFQINQKNFIFLGASLLLIGLSGCSQLYDLPDPTVPLDIASFNSLNDLVSYSKSLGYVPSYSTNGREYGLLSAADLGACVVMRSGNIKCWGYNSTGQLGNASATDSATPVLASVNGTASVSSGDFAVSVSAALGTTCGYFKSGFKCWGDNTQGQLGNGNTTSSNNPVSVSNIGSKTLKSFAVGDQHSCALYTDSTESCWSSNAFGQVGDGTSGTSRLTGVTASLPTGDSVISYIAASDRMTCAVTTSSNGYCWGNTTSTYLNLLFNPTPTFMGSNLTAVSSGDGSHMCFINKNQGLQCFGNNANGQLGNSSTVLSSTLVGVNNLSGVEMVVTGDNHTCAVANDYKNVYCWGDNTFGQVGAGSSQTQFTVPNIGSPVQGFPANSKIVDIAASDKTNCVLLSTDDVYCWGANGGGLGNGYVGVALGTAKYSTAIKILNRADP